MLPSAYVQVVDLYDSGTLTVQWHSALGAHMDAVVLDRIAKQVAPRAGVGDRAQSSLASAPEPLRATGQKWCHGAFEHGSIGHDAD